MSNNRSNNVFDLHIVYCTTCMGGYWYYSEAERCHVDGEGTRETTGTDIINLSDCRVKDVSINRCVGGNKGNEFYSNARNFNTMWKHREFKSEKWSFWNVSRRWLQQWKCFIVIAFIVHSLVERAWNTFWNITSKNANISFIVIKDDKRKKEKTKQKMNKKIKNKTKKKTFSIKKCTFSRFSSRILLLTLLWFFITILAWIARALNKTET